MKTALSQDLVLEKKIFKKGKWASYLREKKYTLLGSRRNWQSKIRFQLKRKEFYFLSFFCIELNHLLLKQVSCYEFLWNTKPTPAISIDSEGLITFPFFLYRKKRRLLFYVYIFIEYKYFLLFVLKISVRLVLCVLLPVLCLCKLFTCSKISTEILWKTFFMNTWEVSIKK